MANDSHVLISEDNRVMTIAWNRPDKKNALTQEMYSQVADALLRAGDDAAVRVVVLTGTEDCFTAGNDLADFLKNPSTDADSPVVRFLTNLSQFNKPIVAAVNGAAVGVGTTMLMHCDMVVAADTTKFSLPFAKLGVCPEGASSYLLPMLAGYQRAAELLMLGDSFDAHEAREFGLVNRIATASDYQAVAAELAARLAAMPPNSIRTTKALLKRNQQAGIAAAFEVEFKQFSAMLSGPEAKEAMSAFMERRAADFSKF
ncbi:MAG: enoyl-CoA hydratase [Thiolinea sp.]